MNIINNIKMKKKLLISYLIIVIVPILVVGYFLTEKLYLLSFDSSVQLSNATFQQMSENFTNKLAEDANIIDSITNDSKLIKYINTQYESDFEAIDDYVNEIGPFISRLESSDRSINIKIYTRNSTIGFSGVTGSLVSELEKESWYKQSNTSQNSIVWTKQTGISGMNNNRIGCYKKIYVSFRTNDIGAVISVFFSEDQLYSLISNEKEFGKVIFLIDEDGFVFTSTVRDLLFKSADTIKFGNDLSVNDIGNSSVVKYGNKNYLAFNKIIDSPEIGIKDWRLLYLLPEDKIIGSINEIWIFSILLCLLCIIFSFIIIIYISDNITNRLDNLVAKINSIWKGNYSIPKEITGSDEIGLLEGDFFKMAEKIDSLINEVYEASLKMKDTEIKYHKMQMSKKDAELIALYSQINPHYFFNTLETIRMNLIRKKDRDTANIVKIFSESFRGYMENENDFHELEKELDLVNNYFNIQRYRFGDKVDLTIDIADSLKKVKILKLIIQPLVENAIEHGLELKLGKGMVIILIFADENNLNILVSDDGVGMKEEELEALKESFHNEEKLTVRRKTHGLALKNIYDRLSLFYGGCFSFNITSKKGTGTRVELSVPMKIPDIGEQEVSLIAEGTDG